MADNFFLVDVICTKTDNSAGPDHIYIKVNASQIWGPTEINNGETKTIGFLGNYGGTVTVELWNKATFVPPDDFLGTNSLDPNGGVHRLHYTGSNSDYTIRADYVQPGLPLRSTTDQGLLTE